jgi:hypothetical protein
MNSPFEAAFVRVEQSLDDFVELFGTISRNKIRFEIKGHHLEDYAKAVIRANVLFSAMALIYDDLYDANRRHEILDRRPENPISGDPGCREQVEVEPPNT